MAARTQIVALCAALALSGCMTAPVEYIEVRPQCVPPEQPALPTITQEELSPLEDDVYFRLERREKRLVDWALEMQGQIEAVCEPPEDQPSK